MKFSDEPTLDQLGQDTIDKQDGKQPGKIAEGQRYHLQGIGETRKGDENSQGHDARRQRQYRSGGPALDEGDLFGTDHMDDEGLGQQTFDEPTTLEKTLVGG